MSRLLKVDNCDDCIFYCEGECGLTREAVGFTIPENCPLPDYEKLIERIEKLEEYFQQHVQDCHRSQSRGCE